MLSANLSAIFYLISGILFILALRGLSSPETSRQGNFFGILGMIIAITVTFLSIGNFSTGFVVDKSCDDNHPWPIALYQVIEELCYDVTKVHDLNASAFPHHGGEQPRAPTKLCQA